MSRFDTFLKFLPLRSTRRIVEYATPNFGPDFSSDGLRFPLLESAEASQFAKEMEIGRRDGLVGKRVVMPANWPLTHGFGFWFAQENFGFSERIFIGIENFVLYGGACKIF